MASNTLFDYIAAAMPKAPVEPEPETYFDVLPEDLLWWFHQTFLNERDKMMLAFAAPSTGRRITDEELRRAAEDEAEFVANDSYWENDYDYRDNVQIKYADLCGTAYEGDYFADYYDQDYIDEQRNMERETEEYYNRD